MKKPLVSNTLLILGILMLFYFVMLEAQGFHSDPLIPAFSAFFIGCTAVLDRVGSHSL